MTSLGSSQETNFISTATNIQSSEEDSSSSTEEESVTSFTESRWNTQKAEKSVVGKPFIEIYGSCRTTEEQNTNTTATITNANDDNDVLLTKRSYPNAFQQHQVEEESTSIIDETLSSSSSSQSSDSKLFSGDELTVISECIDNNYLFGHLETQSKQYLISKLTKLTIRKNEVLFFQGDPSEYCYIVYSGMVDLEFNHSKDDNDDDDNDSNSKVLPILGQLSLWTNTPYNETAKAVSNSAIVFMLSRDHFQRVMVIHNKAQANKKATIDEKIQLLQKAVPSELLEYLQDDLTALQIIAEGMKSISFWKGDILHPKRDYLTIVIEGKLVTSLEGRKGSYQDLYIGPGELQTSFGWRIFASQARVTGHNAIHAETDGRAISISKSAFAQAFGMKGHGGNSVLKQLAERRLAKIQLQQISAFQDSELDTKQINGLIDILHHCEYSHIDNEIIMKAGEKVMPAMYFVREGSVVLERFHGKERQTIHQGEYFGETNMLLDQNKSGAKAIMEIRAVATVIAQPNTKVDILYLEECRKVVDTTLLGLGKPVPITSIDTTLQYSNLQRHQLLGSGGFGEVWLASIPVSDLRQDDNDTHDELSSSSTHQQQKQNHRKMMALKIQDKERLIEMSRSEEAIAERNIMASLNSSFVIQMYNSFQDDRNLYMITSVMQGGQLDSLIPPNQGLSESVAKFYAAGILEGLTHMHRHHIIHRDVKPPNVLIDDQGYPVLIDLGFGTFYFYKFLARDQIGIFKPCSMPVALFSDNCFLSLFVFCAPTPTPKPNTSLTRRILGAVLHC